MRSRTKQAAIQIEYTRPQLYPKQEAAIFNEARYSIIEASTKSGKTAGCMVWIVEQAMKGKPGWNYWWIAPVLPQAKIVYRRLKRTLPREIYTANETEVTLTLINGTVIHFKGADRPDSLYGEDVYAAVMDEASRHKEEAWTAVRSTLTFTKGPIRIIGNVKGKKNWAYQLARRAKKGDDPTMQYHRITAYDAVDGGVLDRDEIEDARDKLPEAIFNELYMAEASDDGGNPFGEGHIRACIAPLSSLPPEWFGIDLAKQKDWTVIIGLDINGHVSYFDRFRLPWQETIMRIRLAVGRKPAIVDSTGVGDPVLEALQRRNDDDSGLILPEHMKMQASNFEGFKFSVQSKQQLMEGLAVSIQKGMIAYPEGPITDELLSMEYVYTRQNVLYVVADDGEDDCAMCLGLANKCRLAHPGFGDGWTNLQPASRRRVAKMAGVRERTW